MRAPHEQTTHTRSGFAGEAGIQVTTPAMLGDDPRGTAMTSLYQAWCR